MHRADQKQQRGRGGAEQQQHPALAAIALEPPDPEPDAEVDEADREHAVADQRLEREASGRSGAQRLERGLELPRHRACARDSVRRALRKRCAGSRSQRRGRPPSTASSRSRGASPAAAASGVTPWITCRPAALESENGGPGWIDASRRARTPASKASSAHTMAAAAVACRKRIVAFGVNPTSGASADVTQSLDAATGSRGRPPDAGGVDRAPWRPTAAAARSAGAGWRRSGAA